MEEELSTPLVDEDPSLVGSTLKSVDSNDDIFASALESPATEASEATLSARPGLHQANEDGSALDSDGETPVEVHLNENEPSMSSENAPSMSNEPDMSTENAPSMSNESDHGMNNSDEPQDEVPLDEDDTSLFGNMREKPKLELAPEKPLDTPGRAEGIPTPQEKSAIMESFDKPTKDGDDYIEITVTDPQKVGDGMGAYVAYKVSTNTNLRYFRRQSFHVLRRFSDFLGLHEKLLDKHLHNGLIIPPAPEKSVVGMTKIKITNQTEQGSSAEFVEKRRSALERYINRTATHPVLRADPDFREFLELDAELPKATNTSALSGAGVMRLFNRVGETVNKMTFKMDENDAWFEEKSVQMENLDSQLRKLHTSVEALVSYRRELANSTASFAKSTAMLSSVEEHTALSRALSQLAEVEEKVEQLHQNQANADFFMLAELLKDYIALIGAVKEVFHERVKAFQMMTHSQQTLTKKREIKAKLELGGRSDKLPQAREEVLEWESKLERSQEHFENISRSIKREMERFDVCRIQDFRATILHYLHTLLAQQQQVIKFWEGFLPEAKAIA